MLQAPGIGIVSGLVYINPLYWFRNYFPFKPFLKKPFIQRLFINFINFALLKTKNVSHYYALLLFVLQRLKQVKEEKGKL
jgi:uncharacterized membrane protein YwzB